MNAVCKSFEKTLSNQFRPGISHRGKSVSRLALFQCDRERRQATKRTLIGAQTNNPRLNFSLRALQKRRPHRGRTRVTTRERASENQVVSRVRQEKFAGWVRHCRLGVSGIISRAILDHKPDARLRLQVPCHHKAPRIANLRVLISFSTQVKRGVLLHGTQGQRLCRRAYV